MSEAVCGVAADTKVETPEGAMTIRTVAGKAIAVFTRTPAGRVRFHMMQDVRKLAEQQPVLKIALENGQSFRVSPQQVLYRQGMEECRADLIQVGDLLESVFHFPTGYVFHDDRAGESRESSGCLRVASIGADGIADLYGLRVEPTGCFMVSAGVLCKAESPQ